MNLFNSIILGVLGDILGFRNGNTKQYRIRITKKKKNTSNQKLQIKNIIRKD